MMTTLTFAHKLRAIFRRAGYVVSEPYAYHHGRLTDYVSMTVERKKPRYVILGNVLAGPGQDVQFEGQANAVHEMEGVLELR